MFEKTLLFTKVGEGVGDKHNKGYFTSPEALAEAYPVGEAGDFAVVESTDTVWVWDSDNSEWVDSDKKGQVTSVNNQTGDVSLGINDVAPTQTGKSGYVLGTDGFVAGWVKPEIVQRSTIPQASEEEVDNIYQYVGTTDANYTNGYFYKCVSDVQTPATYSWENIEVQEADALPSQTGQSGKFLTTDGTDASWGTTVGERLDLVRQSANGEFVRMYYNTTVITQFQLFNANATPQFVFYWKSDTSNQQRGLSFQATSIFPTQNDQTLGNSTNKWANVYTTKINNGADITVPTTGGTMAVIGVNTTITLASANWSSNSQTVNVTGMTATGVVLVSPDPSDQSAYTSAGIICSAQAAGTLTFTCDTVPSGDIDVNVVML